MRHGTFLVLGLLGVLPACGGGGSGGAPTTPVVPTPEPAQSAQRYVIDTRSWSLRGGAGTFYNQDKLPAGSLDVTMEWQNGDNNIQLYLTDNTCPGVSALTAGGCTVLAKSVDPREKPKRISYEIKSKGTNVSVWVYNASRQGDSGQLEVGLTSTERPPTPDPNATPPPDFRATLPDGPVTKAFIKVRSIDQGGKNYRDPFQDNEGNWIVFNGEFVVFDLTQKNAANQECKWINDPSWTVDDPNFTFVLKGSSQPFLLRADVTKDDGLITIVAEIDGVKSNVLTVKARPK